MKKFVMLFAIVAFLFAFTGVAFAAVAVEEDEVYVGEASELNAGRAMNASKSGSTVTLLANGHEDDATTNVSTESNLTSAALAYGLVEVEFSKTRYVALEDGTEGQMITFLVTSTTGKGTSDAFYITDDKVAASWGMTKTGWDDIALDTANDSVTLLYFDDTYGWIIVGQYGATVT